MCNSRKSSQVSGFYKMSIKKRVEFVKNYESKFKALITYFWLKVKYFFRSKTKN